MSLAFFLLYRFQGSLKETSRPSIARKQAFEKRESKAREGCRATALLHLDNCI